MLHTGAFNEWALFDDMSNALFFIRILDFNDGFNNILHPRI